MQQPVSPKTLYKASLTALLVATFALVSFILPAEYNIDPTGLGKALGLTVLSLPSSTPKALSSSSLSGNSTEVKALQFIEINVPAKKGVEYKFKMQQFDKMTYEWLTDNDAIYFDLHGEPEGDKTGYFESYAIASLTEMKGSFTAPFNGSHGWYFKNKTSKPITIQLMVEGQFEIIGLKQ